GADRVDVDVVAPQLLRRHLGQRDDGALAGGVGGVGGARIAAAADRGHVDDAPAAAVLFVLLDHFAGGALQAEEHALGVDPVDAVPIRLGQIHDVGIAGDAGVVDEDVEAAEFGDGAGDHRVDRGDVAAIGGDRQGAVAADRLGGVAGAAGRDVG